MPAKSFILTSGGLINMSAKSSVGSLAFKTACANHIGIKFFATIAQLN